MVRVTERAKQELKRLLAQKVDWPEARLRLMDRGEGILGLGIDIESPGDEIVEYQGVKVLNVDRILANSIEGITIDVDDTPEGAELVIDEAR
ncbi:HesB/IscA family protein [Chloroflexota bacterium]